MARYIASDTQQLFVNGSLESLLPASSVARSIWHGVRGLDFGGFDAKYVNDREGRPAIDPRRLASIWILALMRGVTSSVGVARLCSTDIEFRWLSADGGVEKSSLSAFRRAHIEELSDLSTQILAGLSRSGLLPAEDISVDGTVIRAAASCHGTTNREQLERRLARLGEEIRERLCERDDEGHDGDTGGATLQKRQERLGRALAEMAALGLSSEKRVAVTEPEASVKRLKDGRYAPAHNVQAVTDLGSGAIIHLGVVDRNNDKRLLLPGFEAARARLEQVREKLSGEGLRLEGMRGMAADAGYHDTLQLRTLETSLATYVPNAEQSNRRPTGVSDEYLGERFVYDAASDEMICPQGLRLRRRKLNSGRTAMTYEGKKSVCDHCPAKPQCCPTSGLGRNVNRPLYGEMLEAMARRMNTPAGQWYCRARRVTMEGAFARLTERLHWRRCRCWGKAGALAEGMWRMITHNLLLLIGHWQPLVLGEARPE